MKESREYASQIVNSVMTGEPSVIHGNIGNRGFIPQLPDGCAVEVPVLVDSSGLQPTVVHDRASAGPRRLATGMGAGADAEVGLAQCGRVASVWWVVVRPSGWPR